MSEQQPEMVDLLQVTREMALKHMAHDLEETLWARPLFNWNFPPSPKRAWPVRMWRRLAGAWNRVRWYVGSWIAGRPYEVEDDW